jgi:hypothetical protein
MGQPSVQGHLPALEAYVGLAAGTGLLSLIAFPGGSTPSGARATAYYPLFLVRADRGV